jgi:hypothetical protein
MGLLSGCIAKGGQLVGCSMNFTAAQVHVITVCPRNVVPQFLSIDSLFAFV